MKVTDSEILAAIEAEGVTNPARKAILLRILRKEVAAHG